MSKIVDRATKRIKKIITAKKINHQKIADLLGITRSGATLLLNGERVFSLEQIDKIANYLKIDPVEIIYGEKKSRSTIDLVGGKVKMRTFYIPVLQPAECHQWSIKDMDKLISDQNREVIPVTPDLKNHFVMPMYDMAMISEKSPTLHYNDKLIYDPVRKPLAGDYVIVKLAANEDAICRKFNLVNDNLVLKPLNPRYPDIIPKSQDDYAILGVVTSIITTPP